MLVSQGSRPNPETGPVWGSYPAPQPFCLKVRRRHLMSQTSTKKVSKDTLKTHTQALQPFWFMWEKTKNRHPIGVGLGRGEWLSFHARALLSSGRSRKQRARKIRKFSGPKKEVISILKNACFKGSSAKSWPWAFFRAPQALNTVFLWETFFFLPNHRFEPLQAGLFQDEPVPARFFGCTKLF